MQWRRLLAQRGTPARCSICGAILGELVEGVLVQHHGNRSSLGAFAVMCDRKDADGGSCPGYWLSPTAAARAAAVAAHAAGDTFELARVAFEAAQVAALAAKRLFDAAADMPAETLSR